VKRYGIFYMLDTDIMLANNYLEIFKPKDDVDHKSEKHVNHATLSYVFKHFVIVNRHEPFAKYPSNYNNSSRSAHF